MIDLDGITRLADGHLQQMSLSSLLRHMTYYVMYLLYPPKENELVNMEIESCWRTKSSSPLGA
jgi:hypothetical protein